MAGTISMNYLAPFKSQLVMEDLYDLIENYLDGRLPENEKAAFEERLRQEPSLQEEVEAMRVARQTIEVGIADRLRAELQTMAAENPGVAGPVKGRVVSLKRIMAVAAGFLLLLAIGAYWQAQLNYSGPALAVQFYDDAALAGTRSGIQSANELSPGLSALQAEDYPTAIAAFSAIPDSSAYFSDAQYLLANALYLSGRYDEAIPVLQALQGCPDPLIAEKADWLLALSYLNNGRKEDPAFTGLVNDIALNADHAFHPQAVQVQQKLDSFWSRLAK
jgi:TolA-binding protein